MNHKIQQVADSIACCGLICRLCHLSDTCGGCSSDEGCCGQRKSPHGCYQYNCCNTKGISGCWECDCAPCGEGMFGSTHYHCRTWTPRNNTRYSIRYPANGCNSSKFAIRSPLDLFGEAQRVQRKMARREKIGATCGFYSCHQVRRTGRLESPRTSVS